MGADVYWSNGWDALLQHFSAHSTLHLPLWANLQHSHLFPNPEGRYAATVGDDEGERQGQTISLLVDK